jgi:hypothetical protein
MARRLLLAFVVPMLVIAACSLPTDERAVPYDRDDLHPDIANTTTTTSTTTSTTSTTTTAVPPANGGSTPETTTTTQAPIPTVLINLFYTIGFSDEVARLPRVFQEDASLQQVIQQLETPLSDVGGFGLRTFVRHGLVTETRFDRGVATVVLDASIVEPMSDTNLRRAIAQLVLTITSYETPGGGNVGRVRFESDGVGFAVFVPGFGGSSEPGEEVAFTDFAPLIASTTGTTTTTTTSTAPPTSTETPTDG